MILKCTLEFEKGQAFQTFFSDQNIWTLILALKSVHFTTVPKHDSWEASTEENT